MRATRSEWLWPSSAIVVSAALWGSLWMPLHAIYNTGLSGTWIALLVYSLPIVVLGPLVLYRRRGVMIAQWPHLASVGFFSGVCNILYSVAVVYGDVATVILLFYLNPVWSALLERLVIGTKLGLHRMAAIALGLGGMWVLMSEGSGMLQMPDLAEWSALAAGAFWAAALVAMRLARYVPNVEKAFVQYLFAMVVGGVVIASNLYPDEVQWQSIDWQAAAFWVLFSSFIWVLPSLFLSFWGAARMSPTRASMLFMVEVLVGVATAALWADGPFGWREVIGGSLVIAAGIIDGLSGPLEEPQQKAEAVVD